MYTVLIADDEKIERNGIRQLLKNEIGSYRILEAANGREAEKIIQENKVDILLTDIRMPYVSGLELAKWTAERSSGTEIIIFSGYHDFTYAKSAIRYGVQDYILKPVDPEEFGRAFLNVRQTLAEKKERLKTDNPFGECLWNFDRGGNVDHQTLIVNFENGATGSFSMIGGSAKSERNIHIIGTKGEIKGIFESSKYVLRNMTPSESYAGFCEQEFDLNVTGDMIGAKGGHGGGDENLVIDFIDYINGHEPSVSCTTLEDSVVSHHTVFCANESRKSGKTVLL